MYGLLSTSADGLQARYPMLDNLEARLPQLTPDQQKSRAIQLGTALTNSFSDVKARTAAFTALNPALQAAWPYISDVDVDYAVQMAVAFYKLHGANCAAAQQAIASEVDAELPGPAGRRLRAVGFLLPEARRVFIFNMVCTSMRLGFADDNVLPAIWSEPLKAIGKAVSSLPTDLWEEVWGLAAETVASAPVDKVDAVSKAVQSLVDAKRWNLFQLLDEEAKKGGAAVRYYILREAVCGVHAHLDDAADYFADVRTTTKLWNEDAIAKAFDDTSAAIDAGISFGAYTQTNRDALAAWRERRRENAARQTQTLAAAARARRASPNQAQPAHPQPSLTLSPSSGPDPETLRAWSVEDLARWIEGPVAGPGSKPLDVKAVVARSKPWQPRPQPQPAQAQTSAKDEDEADTLTEDDVRAIASDGYAATAAYFLTEIKELLSVGQRLHASDAALQACADLTAPLEKLAKEPADLEQARLLLTQAEQAIAQLLKSISVVEAPIQLQERFFVQLQGALANETLSPGRRFGGQINCPLKIEDRGWVVQNYHQRLLVGTRVVMVNGQPMRLDTNQALALYVTGSSQSDYPFDVTVHLWERYAGKTLPPGRPKAANERLPLMNTDGWYDTFTTYCVLHVQAAPH